MSAQYWVLVSDELMKTGPSWPAGLRPVKGDCRPPGELHARWWLFEDDGAPPELDGHKVELTFRLEDGEPALAGREVTG
jgi:hypothetical protein